MPKYCIVTCSTDIECDVQVGFAIIKITQELIKLLNDMKTMVNNASKKLNTGATLKIQDYTPDFYPEIDFDYGEEHVSIQHMIEMINDVYFTNDEVIINRVKNAHVYTEKDELVLTLNADLVQLNMLSWESRFYWNGYIKHTDIRTHTIRLPALQSYFESEEN